MHKMSLYELLTFIKESIDVILGEALKNIDKHESGFLESVASKEYWSNIIKLRDLISHHYIDIDAETIFMICDEKLDDLENKISILIDRLK